MQPAAITDPLSVAAVLLALVAVADLAARWGVLRRAGAAILVIALGALAANTRLIPPAASGGPVYDPVFAVVIPAAIFLVLLEVNLAALKRAGGAMLGAFGLGAVGTVVGVLAAHALTGAGPALGASAGPLAGMFTGTYIGGSANFNAVALGFGVAREGTLYTAATVVDNVMTDVWIVLLLALPGLLARLPRFSARRAPMAVAEAETVRPLPGTLALSIPLALAVAAVALSDQAAGALTANGLAVPSILIVTTLALVAAQVPGVRRIALANPLGLWGMFLFLAVVGASADLAALLAARELGALLFAYVAIVFLVHGALLFGVGWLLRMEPVVLAIASSANVGGSASAFVLAEAEGRGDLVLPALLIGSVGTALGTYAGFAMAAALG